MWVTNQSFDQVERGGKGLDVKVILSYAKSYRTARPIQTDNPDETEDLEGDMEGKRERKLRT